VDPIVRASSRHFGIDIDRRDQEGPKPRLYNLRPGTMHLTTADPKHRYQPRTEKDPSLRREPPHRGSTEDDGRRYRGRVNAPPLRNQDAKVLRAESTAQLPGFFRRAAASSEDIPGVNYDSSGSLLGYVNYQPYVSCQ